MLRPLWLASAFFLGLYAGAVQAGSATAESIFSRQAARQLAIEQVPPGARVTRTRCEEIEVGFDNTRYRCTVLYEPAVEDPAVPGTPQP